MEALEELRLSQASGLWGLTAVHTSMALGRMAVITASGFSLAEARDMVDYDGPVARDAQGQTRPEILWAQARLLRFEERSGKRTRFRRRWWRRIAVVQVGGYYLANLLLHVTSVVDLFKGMNLKLPWLTKMLIDPTHIPLPLLLLILALAIHPSRHAEDELEDEALLCLRFNLDLLHGSGYPGFSHELAGCRVAKRLWSRIDAIWESSYLRHSVLEWADLAEWELDLKHENRQVRAVIIFIGVTALNIAGLGAAVFQPIYCLVGCLC